MVLVTATQFRGNLRKYLQIADTETIALKCNGKVYEIKPSETIKSINPSPRGDSWFDNPQNIIELKRRMEIIESGKAEFIEYTPEYRKKILDL